jgi:hypothetical protein
LKVGTEVTCLFGDGRLKNTAFTTVYSEAPFCLDCLSADVQRLSFPRKVILVSNEGGVFLRGEGEVVSVHQAGIHSRMELSRVSWEELERRRYPRIDVKLPVSLRAVYERNGDTVISVVEGVTEDLSVGGSRVKVDTPILVGSLVEFLAQLEGDDMVRALGIVAHSDTGYTIGIGFLDYVGGTRIKLEDYLQSQAA